MNEIVIDGHRIGAAHPPFIIAEAGINHNGSLDLAKQMIDVAKAAGANAVKFQTFKAEEFCGDPNQTFTYQSQGKSVTESMLAMFKRYEFEPEQWVAISKYCRQVGITFFSTPQNRSDLDLLLKIGIPAIKVGSDDFTNLPLLKSYTEAGLPLILSCGMSDISEVHQALEIAGWFEGKPIVLLLCTSQYPTPPEDVNALKLTTLQQAFPSLLVGFSDHTQGVLAATMATALGAQVFEKHFTLDHGLPGPDHWFSEEPEDLKTWILSIRKSFLMLGSGIVRPTSQELLNKKNFQRIIVAANDILEGELFSSNNLTMKRVAGGQGLPPKMLDFLIGNRASRKYKRGIAISL